MTIQKTAWTDSLKSQLTGSIFKNLNLKRKEDKAVLVIHGGAGIMSRAGSTPEQRAKYTEALRGALKAGYKVLESGGEAMDAAVAAVVFMEGIVDSFSTAKKVS